jgi:hypothetical protein
MLFCVGLVFTQLRYVLLYYCSSRNIVETHLVKHLVALRYVALYIASVFSGIIIGVLSLL